ncbi:hypothetical protein L1887_56664 [Cichorium endivia]|nr:hypothetical protein L1887_56664 [Cichorium endivia]
MIEVDARHVNLVACGITATVAPDLARRRRSDRLVTVSTSASSKGQPPQSRNGPFSNRHTAAARMRREKSVGIASGWRSSAWAWKSLVVLGGSGGDAFAVLEDLLLLVCDEF